MNYINSGPKKAAITGLGAYVPKHKLTNADLEKMVDTNDEWITSRTGMKERRISPVPVSELSYIAAARALACAGVNADDVDMIILGSCSFDSQVPNAASRVQQLLQKLLNT